MKLAFYHTDRNTQLHRNGYQPGPLYLVLKRLYLGNESYLSLLRVTSEVELLPLYNQRYNMAATRLKTNNMPLNDEDIVFLPADKGRVTVVMDKTDYHDKMDALANDKQPCEELKRDRTPALQRKQTEDKRH